MDEFYRHHNPDTIRNFANGTSEALQKEEEKLQVDFENFRKSERSKETLILQLQNQLNTSRMEAGMRAIAQQDEKDKVEAAIKQIAKEMRSDMEARHKAANSGSVNESLLEAEVAHHQTALAKMRDEHAEDVAKRRSINYLATGDNKIYSQVSMEVIQADLEVPTRDYGMTLSRTKCVEKFQRLKHLGFSRHPHFQAIFDTPEFTRRFGCYKDVMTGHVEINLARELLCAYTGHDPAFPPPPFFPQGQPPFLVQENIDEDLDEDEDEDSFNDPEDQDENEDPFNDPEDQLEAAVLLNQENTDDEYEYSGEYEYASEYVYSDDDDDDNESYFVNPKDQLKAANLQAQLENLHKSAKKKPRMSSSDTPNSKMAYNRWPTAGQSGGNVPYLWSPSRGQWMRVQTAARAGGPGQDRPSPAANQTPQSGKKRGASSPSKERTPSKGRMQTARAGGPRQYRPLPAANQTPQSGKKRRATDLWSPSTTPRMSPSPSTTPRMPRAARARGTGRDRPSPAAKQVPPSANKPGASNSKNA